MLASEKELKAEMVQQLQLFQDIYKITVALDAVCASKTPDQSEVDRLLLMRQKLINQTADSQKNFQAYLADEQASQESLVIKAVLMEIHSVLKETTALDESVRKSLEKKQNLIKSELFRIQTSKKADKLYHAPVQQNEGYFIDSKKN